MKIPFFKFQGTGNDFILLDNMLGEIHLTKDAIFQLCDRRFGIGSDGIVMLEKSEDSAFYMNFYNPDGSQSFCGNGSRCAVRFAQLTGICGNSGEFVAIDGKHFFESNDNEVRIRMKDVDSVSNVGTDLVVHTGSPHYLVFSEDPEKIDLIGRAREIRYGAKYAEEGINVNFIREGNNEVWMRTYERGVEDETLSCGTGVTAAALGYASRHNSSDEVLVHTKGGDLKVRFQVAPNGGFHNIWLCGPAEYVFEGSVDLKR
jgi:diaminopimelate epimerase